MPERLMLPNVHKSRMTCVNMRDSWDIDIMVRLWVRPMLWMTPDPSCPDYSDLSRQENRR